MCFFVVFKIGIQIKVESYGLLEILLEILWYSLGYIRIILLIYIIFFINDLENYYISQHGMTLMI